MNSLDTRNKIGGPLPGPDTVWVCGYFDPLLAGHLALLKARRVAGKPLAVRILDAPGPILPADARARLVAAIEMVDYVAVNGQSHEPAADAHLRAAFLHDVRSRAHG